LLINCC